MHGSVRERVLRAVPRLLVFTAPPGYFKTTTALAYAKVFKSHAFIDLGRTKTARDLLLALLGTLSSQTTGDAYLRQAQLSLAADETVPPELAQRALDAWRDPGAPAAVVFDNAELLSPDLLPLFNEILERRPAYRTCIVCSDAPLALQSIASASAADAMDLGAGDLALSEEQTRAMFSDSGISERDLRGIIDCAQGWPLLTLLLRHVHAEGRLESALASAEQHTDAQRRYEFIQAQVIEALPAPQRRVVEFCATVIDVREDDVRTCLGPQGVDALRAVRSLPLLREEDHRIDVHPLLRSVVTPANQNAREDLRAAAGAALRRDDRELAARRYVACGDREQAVNILGDMLERGATADVAGFATLLDRDILSRHPRWFALMTLLRRFDVPQKLNLETIQTQRAYLERTGDEMARLAINAIEAHQLLHGGLLDLAQERLTELDKIVAQLKRGGIVNALRAHAAARFVDTLRAGLVFARGDAEQAERLLKRVRFMIGQFPLMNLSAVADGWLLFGLLRADLHLVRSQCARARESLTRSGLDIVLLDLDANEAFAGWVLGDDATYRESLSRLDIRARTYRSRGFDHILGCVGLAAEREASGVEPLRRLVIAHIIAACRTTDERALAHAQRALSYARELRHALFITFASIAVRERGGDPAVGAGEIMELSPQTQAAYLSRLR